VTDEVGAVRLRKLATERKRRRALALARAAPRGSIQISLSWANNPLSWLSTVILMLAPVVVVLFSIWLSGKFFAKKTGVTPDDPDDLKRPA